MPAMPAMDSEPAAVVFGEDNAGDFGVSALKTYSDALVELFKPRARRRLLVDAACERIL